ncbi:MAG TPA: energy transducer TonB [Candidatus Angelobacter sp.]|nr:energy transducer TonB [Candidatus Angelobacter sp.]
MKALLPPTSRDRVKCFLIMVVLFIFIAPRSFAQTGEKLPPATSPCVNDGDKVLYVGNGVTAPRVISTTMKTPDPPEEIKHQKFQGTMVLTVVVGADGRVCDAKIARPASKDKDLHERVLAGVRQWKFEPARKNGKPVAVAISIEVRLDLY